MSTASRPEIGALALQVCAILLFADFLSQLGRFLDEHGAQSVISKLAMVMLGVVGVLLFLVAPLLARRLFGAPVKPLLAHAQAVTFSVLGIWLLITSLSTLAESTREGIVLNEWARGVWPQIAIAILGLLLFVGGAGLSAFWYWMRHAGLTPRAQNPS